MEVICKENREEERWALLLIYSIGHTQPLMETSWLGLLNTTQGSHDLQWNVAHHTAFICASIMIISGDRNIKSEMCFGCNENTREHENKERVRSTLPLFRTKYNPLSTGLLHFCWLNIYKIGHHVSQVFLNTALWSFLKCWCHLEVTA